ncbi:MAG: hypothetical protein CSA75_03635, partial [Sorangium cellulosum]
AACVEPNSQHNACRKSIKSVHLEGSLAPEPSPSLMGKLSLGIKRRPTGLLGIALGLMLTLAGVFIVLRAILIRPSSG